MRLEKNKFRKYFVNTKTRFSIGKINQDNYYWYKDINSNLVRKSYILINLYYL